MEKESRFEKFTKKLELKKTKAQAPPPPAEEKKSPEEDPEKKGK